MSNPFEEKRNFTEHIKSQVSGMKINQAKKIDSMGKDIGTVRMTIAYVAGRHLNQAFKTRTDKDGCLWVMRVEKQ